MPARKRVTLVVDVNVLISMLIRRDGMGLRALFNKQVFHLVVSPLLMEELERVVMRVEFRRYFIEEEAARTIQRVRTQARTVKTQFQVRPICRDPKDDYLLALAKAAKADLLITGDDDLLVLKKHGKTRILKPAAFKKEFL